MNAPQKQTAAPKRAVLPLNVARCMPSQHCAQVLDCARSCCWHEPSRRNENLIDASTALAGEGWCALFIDRRGVDLLGAAA